MSEPHIYARGYKDIANENKFTRGIMKPRGLAAERVSFVNHNSHVKTSQIAICRGYTDKGILL